jgi:glycyl-tRNA synthetase (class II)
MAEIEHYVDPLDKRHARFGEVKDVVLSLLPKDVQSEGKTDLTSMTVGEAVEKVDTSRDRSCSQLTIYHDRKSSITRLWDTFWLERNSSSRRSV